MSESQTATNSVPHLKRVLSVWDLIFYGIVIIQPGAPIPLFGLAERLSLGHTATTILIAMVAMMLTAVSYGRMAALYPAAGSAYTYVGRGINFHLGFLAGWAMFLDYLLIPILNTIYLSLTVQRLVPRIPYAGLVSFFALTITLLNLRGIRTTARSNLILLIFMCAVIGSFIFTAIGYLFQTQGWGGLFSVTPLYNPATFHIGTIATATSLAALTYIGFDSVTTLAEDVENPKRNVLLATVLVCALTGIFSSVQVYLGQRVWPDWTSFPNAETAFLDVAKRVGGMLLFHGMAAMLIAANFAGALSAQAGAARLLFGMGRDNVLPRRVFAYLDPRRSNPSRNIGIIGGLVFVGALLLSYQQSAEVLNFGAFLSFMGVNVAAARQFYFLGVGGRRRRLLADAILPALGFLFCFGIWLGLQTPAKLMGGAWLLLGVVYAAVRTRGFREKPVMLDFTEP
jgi:amino acid transporter